LHLRSQEFSKAIKELQVAAQLDSSPEVRAELAYCFARIGDRRAAEAILEELKQRKLNAYVPPTALAVTLLGLDRLDEALAELERGLSERDEWLLWIDSDPAFAVLKERERFQAIRRTVGLATTVSSDAEHRPSGERGSQPPESLHP
jgi:tetratricopeptide (TPR) repeat protein